MFDPHGELKDWKPWGWLCHSARLGGENILGSGGGRLGALKGTGERTLSIHELVLS